MRYRPWGEQLDGQDETQPAFTGHVKDPETGLTYAQARYYRPGPGQFESVDPVLPESGDVFGFNRYAYASDNPIINTDPDGRQVFGSPDEMMHLLTEEQARAALPSAISAVPVVGDVQNIVEAVNNPSFGNIAIAAMGAIPEGGHLFPASPRKRRLLSC